MKAEEITHTREQLEADLRSLESAMESGSSREIALSRTNLEQAIMWLAKAEWKAIQTEVDEEEED